MMKVVLMMVMIKMMYDNDDCAYLRNIAVRPAP